MDPSFRLAAASDAELLLGMMREYYAFDHHAFDREKAHAALTGLLCDPALGRVWLICAGEENVRIHETKTGKEVMVFQGQPEPVTDMVMAPSGKWLLTASGFGHNRLTLWDLTQGKPVRSIKTIEEPDALAMSSDVKTAVSSGYGDGLNNGTWCNTIRVWNLQTG